MIITQQATLIRSDAVQTEPVAALPQSECRDWYVARFGIDDARELLRSGYHRPSDGQQQLLIVRTEFITHEAQNALLKLLEEPPASTAIVFVIPTTLTILATLTSRCQVTAASDESADTAVFDAFRALSYADRLARIEKALKSQDVEWQRACKQGLVTYLATHSTVEERSALLYAATHLLTRGASNKLLFEQVALLLPLV